MQGKLPAVSRVKLKGYTLLKISLMTLFAPEWLVRSGGLLFCSSVGFWYLLLASGISSWFWYLLLASGRGSCLGCGRKEGTANSTPRLGERSHGRAGCQGNSGIAMWKWPCPSLEKFTFVFTNSFILYPFIHLKRLQSDNAEYFPHGKSTMVSYGQGKLFLRLQ